VTIDISSNKMSLRDRKVGDQRDRKEVQASSIRWRFELRDKAHGNLEADNTLALGDWSLYEENGRGSPS
jgi:hypothetical protein